MGLLGGRLKDDWGRGWLESEVHLRPIGKGVKVGEGGVDDGDRVSPSAEARPIFKKGRGSAGEKKKARGPI